MKGVKLRKWFPVLLVLSFLVVPLAAVSADSTSNGEYSLEFDPNNYIVETFSTDDLSVDIEYRAYQNLVYVSNPVDTEYQSMNFYVPAAYYEGESVFGDDNSRTIPIFFVIGVGGYMPALPGSPGMGWTGDVNAAAVALSKGYIVAMPGCRGRTLQDENGVYYGKAPACIVDLKAAVRYLRYNDAVMPGDAEKIVTNGTSAGGALSSLLGATGNNMDYRPYLTALGAAKRRDDIFAASCYCPITNLDNADAAYEWQYNGIIDYNGFGGAGTLTEEEQAVSDMLKDTFPAYLNRLRLKVDQPLEASGAAQGRARGKMTRLMLDDNGDGNFKDYAKSYVIASAQNAMENGEDLSDLTWITVEDGMVTDIDFFEFTVYGGRMKTPPAFDGLDLNNPTAEANLFGTETHDSLHFTQFVYDYVQDDSLPLADQHIVKMLNPMNYIGKKRSSTAKYWRIRHGTIDNHTSLAIPIILATKLQNVGASVDLALPWNQGHGGDYDLDELFAWIEKICDLDEESHHGHRHHH